MKNRLALLVPALVALPVMAGPAYADGLGAGNDMLTANLDPLNDSGANGTVSMSLEGNWLTVEIHSRGLVPNAPHAQHIHGATSGTFTCPTDADDTDGDGIVSTAEGLPDYGDILISLTTRGDTSKDSGLAVKRFPVADADGNLDYQRRIHVSDAVAQNLRHLHVVQHGIDTNGNGMYDFSAGKSELNPKLPQEATAPALCGELAMTPHGGVEAGVGSTAGTEQAGLIGLGGAALVGSAALAYAVRRRREG